MGRQEPHLLVEAPHATHARGDAAIAFGEDCGIFLDPWQQFAVRVILAERTLSTGLRRWAAFQTGLIVPRQNGKGEILMVVELYWLFVMRERLILHSAHQFKTAMEHFRRIQGVIAANEWLGSRCHVRTSNGKEGVELRDRRPGERELPRLSFIARESNTGRGFTGNKVVLDEALILSGDMMATAMPTMSAVPDAQLVYATSTIQDLTEMAEFLDGVRTMALGDDPELMSWLEWGNDLDALGDVTKLDDLEAAYYGNPAAGIRIEEEYLRIEYKTMRAANKLNKYLVERLGVWPRQLTGESVIPAWPASEDLTSGVSGEPTFAVDLNPDRDVAAIAACGPRQDGIPHLEVIKHPVAIDDVLPYLRGVKENFGRACVVVDTSSPAASLLVDLLAADIEVIKCSSAQAAQAAGLLYDLASNTDDIDQPFPKLRHLHDPRITAALTAAVKKDTGDGQYRWDRRSSAGDITPLNAITLALWGSRQPRPPAHKPVWAY